VNGLKDRDCASSGGLEDGPDIGVELGAPLRAEAVGDLAEDDAGAQRLLRAIVGRRHCPVGDEDKQVLPILLMTRSNFYPSRLAGSIWSSRSSLASSFAT
jgi:hypothetical protein